MGAQQSRTRKLTLENEDPGSVIKVSDEVVERLKGSKAVRQVVDSRISTQQAPNNNQGGQMALAAGHHPFFCESNLTSLQIRQAKLEEMKKNDEYWERRIDELKKCHSKIEDIMDCEYQKAIQEVMGDENPKVKLIRPPCLQCKNAVLACYKQYPNEPMRCAKEVEAFNACVDLSRQALVDTRS